MLPGLSDGRDGRFPVQLIQLQGQQLLAILFR